MIVAGNAADYRGILDTALAEHGIPAFFSLPVDLSSFEAIKLIRTAYAVWCGGFRREDFITYLKCGFSGIPQEEVDRLELYAERWRLFGTRLSDAPLTMYPDGYGIPRNEKEKKAAADALAVLNRSRDTAVASLRALEPACKGKFTIKKHCEMLYRFFIEIGLEEKLYRRAAQAAADGKTDVQAAARLFPAIADAMDLLCAVIPDVELYAQDFSELLSLQFSARGLGSIPPTADAVLVGSADMLRPGEPKHVYLIGVNADIFPTLPHGSAGFSAAECRKLEEAGLVLCSGEIVFASRALFSFLRAFCAAKESVTLSYFLSDAAFLPLARANVIDRILMLAGNRVELLRTAELPDVIYGETALVDREGHFVRMRRLSAPETLTWKSFRQGMLVCHQAFFAKRSLAGPYDLQYRFSADFDWCIRVMKKARTLHNTRLTLIDYLDEGMTTRNRKASLRERFRIMARHYGLISTVLHHAWFVVRLMLKK